MAAGDSDKRGFSGLEDLISDVSKEIIMPIEKPAANSVQSNTQGISNTTQQPGLQTSSIPETTDGGKNNIPGSLWILAIFAAFVIFVNVNSNDKSQDFAAYTPSNVEASTPTSNADVPMQDAAESPEVINNNSNSEEKPPIGTDLVFSNNQIRYCLSEEIRLEAIKGAVNSYSQYEVDNLNVAIQDYNSRCGHFRYRQGALENVRREVNLEHSSLLIEGLNRLKTWSDAVAPSASQTSELNPTTAQPQADTQPEKLPESAEDSNLNEVSSDGQSSIVSACSAERSLGADAYFKCLNEQTNMVN